MKTQKDFRDSRQFATSTWICILIGVFLLAAYTVICTLDNMYNEIVGLVFLSVYVVAIVILLVINRQHSLSKKLHSRENIALSTAMSDLVQKINIPMTITDQNGKIIWYNDETFALSGRKRHIFGMNISELCQIAPDELAKFTSSITTDVPPATLIGENAEPAAAVVDIKDKKFEVRSYEMRVVGKVYYLSVFTDVTELSAVKEIIETKSPVVAYVVIDNLEELAQYVRVSSRDAANEAENVIKAWASDLNALMREYDRDKFLLVFEKYKLLECAKNKFEILEKIRNIRIGDNSMPITVSIGISCVGENMSELELGAQTALDMALQRGGDQVALRGETGLEFFGGRTCSNHYPEQLL